MSFLYHDYHREWDEKKVSFEKYPIYLYYIQRYKIAPKRMPNYRILLFGLTRDLLQNKEIVLRSEKILTAAQLLQELKTSYPPLDKLPSLRIAAEHHFPEADFILNEGMEIALIPPVSGG